MKDGSTHRKRTDRCAFVVGLYLSSANVGAVFGAEFTEVWARNHGAYIRPDADAVWINEDHARREAERAGVDFVAGEGITTKEFDRTTTATYRIRQRVTTWAERVRDSDQDGGIKPDGG